MENTEEAKPEVKELIVKYFKYDILEPGYFVDKDLKKNIIESFTYAYNRHSTTEQIESELDFSEISELRNRRNNIKNRNYKPFPIRLGSLKPSLQEEAMECNESLHHYIVKILLEREKHLHSHFIPQCVKRMKRIYKRKRHYVTDRSIKQLNFIFV